MPRARGAAAVRLVLPDGTVLEKSLLVAAGDVAARRSPVRQRASFVGQLLYPSEPPLDDTTGVSSIRVPYPDRSVRMFGTGLHWLTIFVACHLRLRAAAPQTPRGGHLNGTRPPGSAAARQAQVDQTTATAL